MACGGIRDDVNGGWLKTENANQARKVELDWLHHHGYYVERRISECLERTGANPLRLLWIDTNKGDDFRGNYGTPWCSVKGITRAKMDEDSHQRL